MRKRERERERARIIRRRIPSSHSSAPDGRMM